MNLSVDLDTVLWKTNYNKQYSALPVSINRGWKGYFYFGFFMICILHGRASDYGAG